MSDLLFVQEGFTVLIINETYSLIVENGVGGIVYNKDIMGEEMDVPTLMKFETEVVYKDGLFHANDDDGKPTKLDEDEMRSLCLSCIFETHGGEIPVASGYTLVGKKS